MSMENLKRPSEALDDEQSPAKQAKREDSHFDELLQKVQRLEKENKAQSNTINVMNNKLDKIVRLLSDLTEKEGNMSKHVANLTKLIEKQAEKSKPNASKSMGVFVQNLQKVDSKTETNGTVKEKPEEQPIVRPPVDELDEFRWAENAFFIGDGLITRLLDNIPEVKEKLELLKRKLNVRSKAKDKEKVSTLYEMSSGKLKVPLPPKVEKVILSIGSQDLFEDKSFLTLKEASLEEVKQANKSGLKKKASQIKALIQKLLSMNKKVVFIIPSTCVQRKEVFQHFEEIVTEVLQDLPFPTFKLLNFPDLMYNEILKILSCLSLNSYISISDVPLPVNLKTSKSI